MVYLAGDNNLTEESVFSLTEMKRVPTDGRIAVIAQFDPMASRIPTHRYVIKGAPAQKASSGRAKSSPVTSTIGTDAIPLEDPTIKFPKLSPTRPDTRLVLSALKLRTGKRIVATRRRSSTSSVGLKNITVPNATWSSWPAMELELKQTFS